MAKCYIACDLGAESGRVMLGTLESDRIALEEIHRFPNIPKRSKEGIHWDIPGIFEQLKMGLRKVAERGLSISGISTDSWGVDYVLLNASQEMLADSYHYRDARLDDGFERVFKKIDAEEIFSETGIQFLTINTIYQLNHDVEKRGDLLASADGFLNIADYFNYLFSGVRKAEESLASTTQLYNPVTRDWSRNLIDKLRLPFSLFPPIVPSGTRLGPLLPKISKELGIKNAEVIATCSHDTGAAVVATPGEGKNWAYLSSGTWSLMGIERKHPIITPKSREMNFTNEAGYGGNTRLLKNILGLWLVQECRRMWSEAGKTYSYDDITTLAKDAEPLRSLVNPNAACFAKPDGMPEKIVNYCRKTGQPVPADHGAVIRCILESLALLYRKTLTELEDIAETKIERIHIVGGGCKNRLLNQFSANATNCSVLAGPVEATALGNVIVQALALGDLPSLSIARDLVKNSFATETYLPESCGLWQGAYERFEKLPIEL